MKEEQFYHTGNLSPCRNMQEKHVKTCFNHDHVTMARQSLPYCISEFRNTVGGDIVVTLWVPHKGTLSIICH